MFGIEIGTRRRMISIDFLLLINNFWWRSINNPPTLWVLDNIKFNFFLRWIFEIGTFLWIILLFFNFLSLSFSWLFQVRKWFFRWLTYPLEFSSFIIYRKFRYLPLLIHIFILNQNLVIRPKTFMRRSWVAHPHLCTIRKKMVFNLTKFELTMLLWTIPHFPLHRTLPLLLFASTLTWIL